MKKYLFIMLLLSSNVLVNADVMPIFIDNTEKKEKKSLYRVEALYELYEESPDCILTKQVIEERSFFIKMMRSYTDQLSKDIEAQNYAVAKKTGSGIILFSFSVASLFMGNRLLKKAFDYKYLCNLKKYIGIINSEELASKKAYYIGYNVSTFGGFFFAWESGSKLGEAITYKKKLMQRYEVGKKILAQLEQAEETVAYS